MVLFIPWRFNVFWSHLHVSPKFLSDPPSTSHPILCSPTFKRKQKPAEFSLSWLPGLGPAWSVIDRSHCMKESWFFLSPKQSDGRSSHLSLSLLGFFWAWTRAGSVMRDSSGLRPKFSKFLFTVRFLSQVTGVRLGDGDTECIAGDWHHSSDLKFFPGKVHKSEFLDFYRWTKQLKK